MTKCLRPTLTVASYLAASILLSATAHAGMGNRGTLPHYTPEPCQGDACRADDRRSGLPCEGLLCTFSSAKAMQPPTTAANAAEAQKAAAVETVKPIDVAPAPLAKTKKMKAKAQRQAKVSVKTESADAANK